MDDRLSLTVYAAEPASATAQALTLLGAWAATRLPLVIHRDHRHSRGSRVVS